VFHIRVTELRGSPKTEERQRMLVAPTHLGGRLLQHSMSSDPC
jgi:hypothetical protein